jgi:hypothetical protein
MNRARWHSRSTSGIPNEITTNRVAGSGGAGRRQERAMVVRPKNDEARRRERGNRAADGKRAVYGTGETSFKALAYRRAATLLTRSAGSRTRRAECQQGRRWWSSLSALLGRCCCCGGHSTTALWPWWEETAWGGVVW